MGASLFDDRYGLADRRPRELVEMPFLANDRLDPERSHGDLLAHDHRVGAPRHRPVRAAPADAAHAPRLVLHWMIDGFNRRGSTAPRATGSPRNLMGFVDGTANLDAGDDGLMDRYVWVAAGDGEPAWAVGGTYHVVRVIRMFVEFWDRTPLAEQEAIIGPPEGQRRAARRWSTRPTCPTTRPTPTARSPRSTPTSGSPTRARPRPRAASSCAAGFSFSRGFDGAGRLDQGLAFVCYQRSLERSFLAVQARLSGEPLEEYILPEGGGFFFALPGAEQGSYLGQALVA